MKRLLYILSILLCLASCKEDEVIISQHGTTYDTVRVNVRQNLYDTVRQLIYDTTRTKVYDTVHATVNDTVWNHQTITSYDTIRTLISDTITIKNYDTVRIVKTITNYDTVKTVIKDTIITKINDTIWSHRTINDTVWSHQIVKDTVWDYQTVVKYDTVKTKVNDTVWSYETVVRYDTVKVKVNDTIWSHQTVNDTVWNYETVVKYDTVKVDIYDTVKVTITDHFEYHCESEDLGQYLDNVFSGSKPIDIVITDENPNLADLKDALVKTRAKYKTMFNLNLEHCVGLSELPTDAFFFLQNLNKIKLPNSIKKIGKRAFEGCLITAINISEGVREIGEGAFNGCQFITSITIPNGITSIEKNTFTGCQNLTSIEIPESVTHIGQYAFQGCTNIKTITIPQSVTNIEQYALWQTATESLILESTTPPTTSNYILAGQYDGYKGTIYVPKSAVEAYKKADGWSRYANNIVGY